MVLYACVLCFMQSRFIENPPIDLEAMNPSFLRWFCHNIPREKMDEVFVEQLENVSLWLHYFICNVFYSRNSIYFDTDHGYQTERTQIARKGDTLRHDPLDKQIQKSRRATQGAIIDQYCKLGK
jgi:hypothetical protein